jgi:hypothetical protein
VGYQAGGKDGMAVWHWIGVEEGQNDASEQKADGSEAKEQCSKKTRE